MTKMDFTSDRYKGIYDIATLLISWYIDTKYTKLTLDVSILNGVVEFKIIETDTIQTLIWLVVKTTQLDMTSNYSSSRCESLKLLLDLTPTKTTNTGIEYMVLKFITSKVPGKELIDIIINRLQNMYTEVATSIKGDPRYVIFTHIEGKIIIHRSSISGMDSLGVLCID